MLAVKKDLMSFVFVMALGAFLGWLIAYKTEFQKGYHKGYIDSAMDYHKSAGEEAALLLGE